MKSLLLQNLNAFVVLAGFVAFEVGVSVQWSGAVASIVGGVVVMGAGSWPYVAHSLRKRS